MSTLSRIKNFESFNPEERLRNLCQSKGLHETIQSECVLDVIVDQFKNRIDDISLVEKKFLNDDTLSLDCEKMKECLSSKITALNFKEQLKDLSEYLGCVILIFAPCDQSPIYSLIPSNVKIPVPIFLGILMLQGPTFFFSLRNNPCENCYSSHCSCDSFPRQSTSEDTGTSSCRCGQNKKSAKPSCFGTKRCPCFSSSSGCNSCKCKNCNNPYGKRNLEIVNTITNPSQRLVDARASHAGKLSRQIDQSEFERVKPDWNIFEKILLKRILRSSADKELGAIHAIYCNYSQVKKSIYVFVNKSINGVKKALNKLQLQAGS